MNDKTELIQRLAAKAPVKLSPANQRALEDFDRLPDSARVRIPVVAALDGVSIPTVWRRIKIGLLPEPEKVGGTTTMLVGKLRRARASSTEA